MTIGPQGYNRGLRVLERVPLASLRRQLLGPVHGKVLELGAGSGANFVFYDSTASVTALDMREANAQAAIEKSNTIGVGAPAVSVGDAQALPFPSAFFDAVVASLVFCSIRSPEQALREICRVLRSNGTLHLLEHVRGQGFLARAFTDVAHPFWFAIQGECHLNRETAATVAASGFTVQHVSTHGKGLLQVIRATPPVDC